MMSFLQTGKALYVLAAICLAGIFTRLAAGSFYKRLIKESTNLALTKNKCLRALRQNAEDTYRINQGMSNTRVYLERQMYGMRMMGMSVRGLDNLSGQLTLLCFLAGGAGLIRGFPQNNREFVGYCAGFQPSAPGARRICAPGAGDGRTPPGWSCHTGRRRNPARRSPPTRRRRR